MGIYVNPDGIDFQRAVDDDIYIDKSKLIACTNARINKARRYLCVSRPRRFGKSMAADMLGEIDPSTFQNDMTTFKTRDDVFTLLVHLGYLTYDDETSEVFIPNQEISQEFMRAIKVGGWEGW